MIDDIGGHEIGIFAGEPVAAEGHHSLRHIERDDVAAAEPGRRDGGNRLEVVLGRQLGEGAVDQFASRLGIDVADDRDRQIVARKDAAHIIAQVGDADARHGFECALGVAAIGMVREGRLPPVVAADVVRIGGVAAQA